MNSLLPPLDFPLSLNPSAPSQPRPVLPFSLLIEYVGPRSPISWSRPASPVTPRSPLNPSSPHVLDSPSSNRRPRSRSRSLRSRNRPPPLAAALVTPTSSPVPDAHAARDAALDRDHTLASTSMTPPLAPRARTSTADESQKVVKVIASNGRTGEQCELSYSSTKVVGNGSFGVVFAAKLAPGSLGPDNEGDDDVAIKKVLQDKRFKNRELQIMRVVRHPNVVNLRAFFYSNGDKPKKDEVYLNLVLEYVPETVYRASRHYAKLKQTMPMAYIKLYMYQLMRSLAYIHSIGICHRDIKPQNLLLNPPTGVLKLCDFGSAKILVEGEPNVSYICSRYYRAPELIFGATNYTTNIDVWSAGCVMAELMLGQPLFPGESGIDQLVEIIKVLGTPTREQIKTMNPNYMEHKFPQIKPHPFVKVFRPRTPPEAIDLISKLLEYTPSARLTAIESMCHPFFDDLKVPDAKMPTGKDLPPLFDFTREELSCRPDLIKNLVPAHAEQELLSRGVDVNNFDPIPLDQMRVHLD
ncbi:hypothetical protein NBRC10512_003223 [Rhodotorula toruloides]|uniref:Glycogen synthase kinase 3 beta n=1 Tax=Rhodotorula toruloides (strain NP11) TaxID=1130832 RepID=M7X0K2_RHOT1|nr:glycogen synthase kinase 3 beta [Rhodotorula toruloides NP11]EMS23816.1 glycogen synthase kinase 3 beta [Rhodotorula toruloides NP11]